jgi:hypothetical protein
MGRFESRGCQGHRAALGSPQRSNEKVARLGIAVLTIVQGAPALLGESRVCGRSRTWTIVSFTKEDAMGLYLSRARYNAESYKAMLAKPEDRTPAVKALFEAAGQRLLQIWFSPTTCDVFMVSDGDIKSGATIEVVAMASGAYSEVAVVELVTMQQLAEAMKSGAAIAAKFRAPGR